MKKYNYLLLVTLIFSWTWFIISIKNCNKGKVSPKKTPNPTDSLKKTKITEKDTTSLISYWNLNNENQIPYETKELQSAKIKLFPNYQSRNNLNVSEINNVYGINQFFMDFDMTTGYVHEYTNNFYKKLRSDDYVLILNRDKKIINEGIISYARVKNLTSNDKLGQNVGFFRQWKLSEIDIKDSSFIMFRKSGGSYFMQTKQASTNPFRGLIPLWSKLPQKDGYIHIENLDKLSDYEGGTAVILWVNQNEIFFKDIHGSIKDIIKKLYLIKNKYKVDPVLGIFDAGPMARKFKSNIERKVLFSDITDKISTTWYVGAGFGYKIDQ
jgi:hypothetical protein